MNYNISVRCNTCNSQTNCRIGLSNRQYQPLRFRCNSCGTPIDITLIADLKAISVDIQVKGAKEIDPEAFNKDVHFVDLHLDFPVSFEPYVMGKTPFLSASMRVGHHEMRMHSIRMNFLNLLYDHVHEIKEIILLYANQNEQVYKEKVLGFIESSMDCDSQIDRNRALYFALEKAFFPFSEPERNANSVRLFTRELERIRKRDGSALSRFLDAIVSNDFLKNLQLDCLEIYPRIIDIELMLRPALFLDFDNTYDSHRVAYRVSSHEFLDAKDLYKDIAEIISRALVLVAGINNLKKRGSHDEFSHMPGAPRSLDSFADLPLGIRMGFIDETWYPIEKSVLDNELRNAVAHYRAEYDEVTQEISYFPKREGMKQEKSETMYFLDFSRRILTAFRELHRLNHLAKCLFVFYYIDAKGEDTTPCDM